MLLEDTGFTVKKMVIQAICRDSNLKTAAERNIDRTAYLTPINKISDHWLISYFSQKAVALNLALLEKKLPPVCKPRERWNDKKCEKYCAASEHCPYAKRLLLEKEGVVYASNTQDKIKIVTLEYHSAVNLVLPFVKSMENSLKAMWEILHCHHVSCTQIKIEDKFYDGWSDDGAKG